MKYVIIRTIFNYLELDEGGEPDRNVLTELATPKLFSTKAAATEEVKKLIDAEIAESSNNAEDVGEIAKFEVDEETVSFDGNKIMVLVVYFKFSKDEEYVRDTRVEYKIEKVEEN